ncbi:SMP-30/gluconolactonase/LRE family protein [Sphingobium cloacae]|uniref:Gluconolactonase n=1 Tax=Sphingobium cloacae TaxID=120107 RepID=A0A1E1EXR2_9SPHN|nr:SMP-30/gluconolactonase/LRE family protein [Sphingobium cloacae]BAV63055.1 gluconolactonase [Sphingobium cloacae]
MSQNLSVRAVAEGLGFLEGPVALEDNRLLFTDIGAGTLNVLDLSSGQVTVFANVRGAANGVAIGPDGAFYVCNNGGMTCEKSKSGYNVPLPGTRGIDPISPCIQRVSANGAVEVLYTHCGDIPLIAPNDLVFDKHGGFYFTDTGHPTGRNVDLGGLYYAKADGSSIIELIHESPPHLPLSQPNGCGLSPDGSRLYVAETAGARIWYWNIRAPGELQQEPEQFIRNGGVLLHGNSTYQMYDSLAIDSDGNICVAAIIKGGIDVVDPEGNLLYFVSLPLYDPFPTNICFGGADLQKAYITASGTGIIYEVSWPTAGLKLNY